MAASSDPASLDKLHDIVVPAPVPWWPLAPGWYWLAAVLAVLATWWAWRALRRHRADAYRRAALVEFAKLTGLDDGSAAADAALRALPALLKRAALTAYPRQRVAAFSGPPWWAFLDTTSSGAQFGAGAGAVLDTVAYDPGARIDAGQRRALLAAAEHWLRHHRRGCGERAC